MSGGLSSIRATLVNCISNVYTFSMFLQFKCVRAVLKAVVLTKAQLYHPMPDQIVFARNE